MNLKSIKYLAGRHWHNIPGWRTNRKIVVFESDDWGSIRMPSRHVYESLLKRGLGIDKLSFNKFDSLCSEQDLSALLDILTKFKDRNGKHPVITTNTIVANPDFEKIKRSNYQEYSFELFTETLKKYPKHQNSFELMKEGIEAGLLFPQFHGREHLNVRRWLLALQNNNEKVRLAFENSFFDLSESGSIISENSFMDALSYNNAEDLNYTKATLKEGLDLFERIFGFRSDSFIASCYIWAPEHEEVLVSGGVRFIQGSVYQKIPVPERLNKYIFKRHYIGEKNSLGQTYLVRNCFFEPSENGDQLAIKNCLRGIEVAFNWGKPAIISTHRVNYIGSIFPENRLNGLKALEALLNEIIKRFPDVEFFTTSELGCLIETSLKKKI